MKNRFMVKLLITCIGLFLIEYFILWYLEIDREKMIENMIQLMILNVAGLAFYTWYEDNRRSNVELVFAFDRRWDEIIKIIDDELSKITKEFAKDKADNKNKEYLMQLKKTQNKLRFLLKKINYYEGKNIKEKSYIDLNSVVEGMNEAITLILDTERNKKKIKEILDIYKNNLENIKDYINKTNIYTDDDQIIKNVEKVIEYIKNFEDDNEDDTNDSENRTDINDKEACDGIIGTSVGNNRYFKPKADSNHYVYTSRNWNEEDNENYGTWYTIPKTGKGSVNYKKDYYFIVREANEENLYPYLFIENGNLKKMIKKKNKTTGDNLIHFYFKWNKYDYTLKVTDERNGITLPKGKYELGEAELKGKTLYKISK